MGILGLGLDLDESLAGFPVDLFLTLLGLSGGMPTLVSVASKQWALVAEKLGLPERT